MELIHVAVGLILKDQQVLIALRKPEQHQGGLWEFSGGKVEAGESVFEALSREIHEELNVTVVSAVPFTQVTHDYGDKSVLLDVWQVEQFSGVPQGREGQLIKWSDIATLHQQSFPAANEAIVQAIQQKLT